MVQCVKLSSIDQGLTCADSDNQPGIASRVIFGYWEDVEVWPALPVPAADAKEGTPLEDAGALVGDLTMKAGTKAYTFEYTEDTGSFSIAPQGDAGNTSFLYSLTIISAKIRKKVLGFMNAAKNRKMFLIVEDNNGMFYLMGDKRRGAMLQPGDGAQTGQGSDDQNRTTIQFTYRSARALMYVGDTEDIVEETT